MKDCPTGKIRNPATNRCIDPNGRTAKKIGLKSPKGKSPKGKAKSPKKVKSPKLKPCPPGKVRNPATNRCRKIKKAATPKPATPTPKVTPVSSPALDWELIVAELLPRGKKRDMVLYVIRNNKFDWYNKDHQIHATADIMKFIDTMPDSTFNKVSDLLDKINPQVRMDAFHVVADNLF